MPGIFAVNSTAPFRAVRAALLLLVSASLERYPRQRTLWNRSPACCVHPNMDQLAVGSARTTQRAGVVLAFLLAVLFGVALVLGTLTATDRALIVGFGAFDVGLGSVTAARVQYLGLPRVTQSSLAAPGARYCAATDPHHLVLGGVAVGIVGCNHWELAAP